MAGSLLALLDDIVSVLDDVSLMTKMAAKKTVGVVGDDLALNANSITDNNGVGVGVGVAAERELPIVFKVAIGSLINKFIIIPIILVLSIFLPSLIQPLLMIGGAYLCYEGFEKVIHSLDKKAQEHNNENQNISQISEKERVFGAIKTDFVLSAEIMVLSLSVFNNETTLLSKIITLSCIGIGMTIFVYGLVAIIVKMDDFGFWLKRKSQNENSLLNKIGNGIIFVIPHFMRCLTFFGTVAMFLVGGGIFTHYEAIHHFIVDLTTWVGYSSGFVAIIVNMLIDSIIGFTIGAIIFGFVEEHLTPQLYYFYEKKLNIMKFETNVSYDGVLLDIQKIVDLTNEYQDKNNDIGLLNSLNSVERQAVLDLVELREQYDENTHIKDTYLKIMDKISKALVENQFSSEIEVLSNSDDFYGNEFNANHFSNGYIRLRDSDYSIAINFNANTKIVANSLAQVIETQKFENINELVEKCEVVFDSNNYDCETYIAIGDFTIPNDNGEMQVVNLRTDSTIETLILETDNQLEHNLFKQLIIQQLKQIDFKNKTYFIFDQNEHLETDLLQAYLHEFPDNEDVMKFQRKDTKSKYKI